MAVEPATRPFGMKLSINPNGRVVSALGEAAALQSRAATEPGIRDIPGGNAAARTSSTAVSIIRAIITEDLCTYTILYFHQEKCFRDHGATRSPPRVYAGSGGRSAALPAARGEPLSTVIIFP